MRLHIVMKGGPGLWVNTKDLIIDPGDNIHQAKPSPTHAGKNNVWRVPSMSNLRGRALPTTHGQRRCNSSTAESRNHDVSGLTAPNITRVTPMHLQASPWHLGSRWMGFIASRGDGSHRLLASLHTPDLPAGSRDQGTLHAKRPAGYTCVHVYLLVSGL